MAVMKTDGAYKIDNCSLVPPCRGHTRPAEHQAPSRGRDSQPYRGNGFRVAIAGWSSPKAPLRIHRLLLRRHDRGTTGSGQAVIHVGVRRARPSGLNRVVSTVGFDEIGEGASTSICHQRDVLPQERFLRELSKLGSFVSGVSIPRRRTRRRPRTSSSMSSTPDNADP
jgi:hypothetical protein